MAHAVDEPGVIERLFIEQAGEVIADFILVRPVFNLLGGFVTEKQKNSFIFLLFAQNLLYQLVHFCQCWSLS